MSVLETQDGYTASGLYRSRTPGAADTTVSLIGWRDAASMATAMTTELPGQDVPRYFARLQTGQYQIIEHHGSQLPPAPGAFATLVPFSFDGIEPDAVRQHVHNFITLESGSPGWQQAVVLESLGGDPRYDLIVLSAWESEAAQVAFYQQPVYLSAIQEAAAASVIPEGGSQFLERIAGPALK